MLTRYLSLPVLKMATVGLECCEDCGEGFDLNGLSRRLAGIILKRDRKKPSLVY